MNLVGVAYYELPVPQYSSAAPRPLGCLVAVPSIRSWLKDHFRPRGIVDSS